MSDIKAYRCPNCGQMVDPRSLKCEYCGTQYEREGYDLKPMMIQVVNAKVVPLQVSRAIRDDYIHVIPAEEREDFIEYNLKSMARELAEHIVPYMEVRSYKDMETMTTIIGGRIKVIEPDERIRDWRLNL